MESFFFILLILFMGTYILARLSALAQQSRWEKIEKIREQNRKNYIDSLYGRDLED